MRNERRSIFFLVVVIFLGLNILTEFSFSSSSQSNNFSMSFESVHAIEISGSSVVDSKDNADRNCSDPCHVGRCHFGHCAVPSQNRNEISFYGLGSAYSKREVRVPNSPILDGPKRPPRFA
ncbi:MAG: hypothetical protein AB7O96_16625 [Pseudobdellovibrionaceae bacterium]